MSNMNWDDSKPRYQLGDVVTNTFVYDILDDYEDKCCDNFKSGRIIEVICSAIPESEPVYNYRPSLRKHGWIYMMRIKCGMFHSKCVHYLKIFLLLKHKKNMIHVINKKS